MINVLSGSSLIEPFEKTNIGGERIICRECLIDGDLKAENLQEFWTLRRNYLGKTYVKPDNFYEEKVQSEFDRLVNKAEGNEINLWFEYELFCQIHFWFCLYLLKDKNAKIYIVYPKVKEKKDIWKGFGHLDVKGLKESFDSRIRLENEDVLMGAELWKAFQQRDFAKLKDLSQTESKAFPTLKEVGQAAIEIETRPRKSLEKIIKSGKTDFGQAFSEFNETEDIYGFGDLQVKKIYDELMLK
jgi:hypothetical protein